MMTVFKPQKSANSTIQGLKIFLRSYLLFLAGLLGIAVWVMYYNTASLANLYKNITVSYFLAANLYKNVIVFLAEKYW